MPVEAVVTAVEKGVKVTAKTAEGVTKVSEVASTSLEATAENVAIAPDVKALEGKSFTALSESSKLSDGELLQKKVDEAKKTLGESSAEACVKSDVIEGLNDEQKALIMKETGWPQEIADCIESMDQYEVYKNANLHYAEIDCRPCLVKDIDMDYVDPKTGLTNRELLEKGRAPFDAATGEKIELHHMGQDFSSPFAELCENSEHGDGKDGILHDKKIESWRREPEMKNQYATQRANHWKSRSTEVLI